MREGVGGFNTWQALEGLFQLIEGGEHVVIRAGAGGGFDHGDEDVAAGGVVADEIRIVLVVGRVGAKFGRAGVDVPDLELVGDAEAEDGEDAGDRDGDGGVAPLGEEIQEGPNWVFGCGLLATEAALGGFFVDADEAEQQREHDEVGEDEDEDAEAGDDGEFLNRLDVDQEQNREAHRVTYEGGEASQKKAPESKAGGDEIFAAAADVLHDAVHFLRAVTDADGEDEERDEDGIRIEIETKTGQATELPENGGERAGEDQDGAADAAGEPEDDGGADGDGDGEEEDDLVQIIDEVANHHGEADGADGDALGVVLLLQRADFRAERPVIKRFAGAVMLQQRDFDDAGGRYWPAAAPCRRGSRRNSPA